MAASKATEKVTQDLAIEVKKRQSAKAKMVEAFMKEEQVEVSGSPFYQPYFGGSMPIMLNGVMVYVPLDGRPYKIPTSFADIFNERIKRVDAQNQRMETLGAVLQEDYIGGADINIF